jgi:hypothetical protein
MKFQGHLYPAVSDRLIREAKSMDSLLACLEYILFIVNFIMNRILLI